MLRRSQRIQFRSAKLLRGQANGVVIAKLKFYLNVVREGHNRVVEREEEAKVY